MEQKTEFLFRKTPRASFGKQREENYKVRKWTVKRTRYWIHEALRGDFFFFFLEVADLGNNTDQELKACHKLTQLSF